MGIAKYGFLMLKGFHPENHENQKRVWEAEQAQKDEVARQVRSTAIASSSTGSYPE